SRAWRTGVDEWGRVWRDGVYVDGIVDTTTDLDRYSPPLDHAKLRYDEDHVRQVRERYPDHCLIFGTHIGPFTAGYMAMGFERFFTRLFDDPEFAHRLLDARTAWCIAMYKEALRLGADVLVLGDDAGHSRGPMISTSMWRDFVLPYHRRIVAALDAPVIWHSDGNIVPLLSTAVEAGFAGIHGLDPIAGVDLGQVKRDFGRDLALIGNVDVRVLCRDDLDVVRAEVDRCLAQGASGGAGGYMLASCNSIFDGMDVAAVKEFFRYAEERVTGYWMS
ncbi:MAG: uroporphyrinogen decarboxylase family protein, partial [Anaerolineae bacterium]